MAERQQELAFPEDEQANAELNRLMDVCMARHERLEKIFGFRGVVYPSPNKLSITILVDPLANGTTHEQIRAIMEDVPFRFENTSQTLIETKQQTLF